MNCALPLDAAYQLFQHQHQQEGQLQQGQHNAGQQMTASLNARHRQVGSYLSSEDAPETPGGERWLGEPEFVRECVFMSVYADVTKAERRVPDSNVYQDCTIMLMPICGPNQLFCSNG